MSAFNHCPFIIEMERFVEAKHEADRIDGILGDGATEVRQVVTDGPVPDGWEEVACAGCGEKAHVPPGTFPPGAAIFCRDCAQRLG